MSILIVGSERPDEFADAFRLANRGNHVIVVNPRETHAARQFKSQGGVFLRSRLEDLPPDCSCFQLICENYPYPSGELYVPPRAFAWARLSRLGKGGHWILFTEARRFAGLLKAAVDYDDDLRGKFTCHVSRLSLCEAPPSTYPPHDFRTRLVFERRR